MALRLVKPEPEEETMLRRRTRSGALVINEGARPSPHSLRPPLPALSPPGPAGDRAGATPCEAGARGDGRRRRGRPQVGEGRLCPRAGAPPAPGIRGALGLLVI